MWMKGAPGATLQVWQSVLLTNSILKDRISEVKNFASKFAKWRMVLMRF